MRSLSFDKKVFLSILIVYLILLSGCQTQHTFTLQKTDNLKEVDKLKNIIERLPNKQPVTAVEFRPKYSTQVALTVQSGSVYLWNFIENKLLPVMKHKFTVMDIVFNSDGSLLVSGGFDDKTVKIWDIEKNKEIQRFSIPEKVVKIALSPDDNYIAIGAFKDESPIGNHDVIIWDIRQNKEVRRLKKHTGGISSVVFGQAFLVSGSMDGVVHIWNWQSGDILKTFRYGLLISSVALSHDDKLLAVGLQDGSVQVVDIATGHSVQMMKHDSWTTQLISFQKDKYLLSSSFQNKITIQKLEDQQMEKEIVVYQTISSAKLNQEENKLAVSAMDGTVRIYDLQGKLHHLLVMGEMPEEWISCGSYIQGDCLESLPPISIKTLFSHHYTLLFCSFFVILFYLFYQRFYKHPLVLKLSANPQMLFELPVQQLPEVKKLLRMTGRLNTTLVRCQISPRVFKQAVNFVKAIPEIQANVLMQRLMSDSIELQTSQVFLVKLPPFHLNLDNCLFYFPEKHLSVNEIIHHLEYQEVFQGKKVIVVTLDLDKQQGLRPHGEKTHNEHIIPDGIELTKWLLSEKPIETFCHIISKQLRLDKISPYQMSGGLEKEASFFGRTHIISDILSREPRNYLIVGGRQIGKTSLLKYLEREYKKKPNVEVHYLCLFNDDIVKQLSNKLGLPKLNNLDNLNHYLEDTGNLHIFLLDETDALIKFEKQRNYANLEKLRNLASNDKCYFILAGVWYLYESVTFEYYSPLRNFGELITLGELEYEACHNLVIKPLDALSISIDVQLTQSIIEKTGQRANLIAKVCHLIVHDLSGSIVDKTLVDKVFREQTLLQPLLSSWHGIAPTRPEKKLDKMIVYSTIQQESFTLKSVLDTLTAYQFSHSAEDVKRSLARLSLELIFKECEHNQYQHAIPLLRDNLLKENSERLIQGLLMN